MDTFLRRCPGSPVGQMPTRKSVGHLQDYQPKTDSARHFRMLPITVVKGKTCPVKHGFGEFRHLHGGSDAWK